MTGLLALLRCLARPLAALGIVLTLMAMVVPAAARDDGASCIGGGATIETDALGAPFCESCILVALPAPPPPAVPGRDGVRAEPAAALVEPLGARTGEVERIRDPPAI